MPKWMYYVAALLLAISVGSLSVYVKGLDLADLSLDSTNGSFETEENNNILNYKLLDVVPLYNDLEKIKIWSFFGNKPRKSATEQQVSQPVKKVSIPHFLGISTVGKIKYAIFELNNKVERIAIGEMLSNGSKLIRINNRKVSISMTNGNTMDLQLFKGK